MDDVKMRTSISEVNDPPDTEVTDEANTTKYLYFKSLLSYFESLGIKAKYEDKILTEATSETHEQNVHRTLPLQEAMFRTYAMSTKIAEAFLELSESDQNKARKEQLWADAMVCMAQKVEEINLPEINRRQIQGEIDTKIKNLKYFFSQ